MGWALTNPSELHVKLRIDFHSVTCSSRLLQRTQIGRETALCITAIMLEMVIIDISRNRLSKTTQNHQIDLSAN